MEDDWTCPCGQPVYAVTHAQLVLTCGVAVQRCRRHALGVCVDQVAWLGTDPASLEEEGVRHDPG